MGDDGAGAFPALTGGFWFEGLALAVEEAMIGEVAAEAGPVDASPGEQGDEIIVMIHHPDDQRGAGAGCLMHGGIEFGEIDDRWGRGLIQHGIGIIEKTVPSLHEFLASRLNDGSHHGEYSAVDRDVIGRMLVCIRMRYGS